MPVSKEGDIGSLSEKEEEESGGMVDSASLHQQPEIQAPGSPVAAGGDSGPQELDSWFPITVGTQAYSRLGWV